jgi:hypothetical protein
MSYRKPVDLQHNRPPLAKRLLNTHWLNHLLRPLMCALYPGACDASPVLVFCSVFFMQKIVGIHRLAPWPVHFTTRIIYRERIKRGNRTYPGWSQGCYIQARNGIEIGHNLRMGPNVGLISSNHDPNDYDKAVPAAPIRIGNNVWLGMNTVVLPAITIGDNVIIGANSVVTHDIPSNVIAAGNPCRVLRPKPPYQGREYAH